MLNRIRFAFDWVFSGEYNRLHLLLLLVFVCCVAGVTMGFCLCRWL